MNFEKQIQAMRAAYGVVTKMPPGAVWSLCITDVEGDAALSVFASPPEWSALRAALCLGRAMDVYSDDREQFESYHLGTLTVSLIWKKEEM